MKPTLMVLAAGIGSRYGGLKQLDPVGPHGELIIDYSVFDAIRAGFGKVVFVIRRDIEMAFREAIGSRFEGRLPVEYAFQERDALPDGFALPPDRTKPWGTGHAILVAQGKIREPFAVINADDFYGRSGYRILAERLSQAVPGDGSVADFCMTGFVLRNTLSEHGHVARGICRTGTDGMLANVTECTHIRPRGNGAVYQRDDGHEEPLTGDEVVSMNMWGFTPALFPMLEAAFVEFLRTSGDNPKAECFIPSVVDNLIQAGRARVAVLPSADRWYGVTYREDKPQVEAGIRALVARGEYPAPLWQKKA
jgi:dTDP-glucose pyrophosphorylase